MWTLILTIFLFDRTATVDHVEGFASYNACMLAAAKWGEDVLKQAPPGTKMSARCVSLVGTGYPVAPAPKR